MLEARDRVGGRLWTGEVDGAMLEIGGQWVSPDQDALIETLDELGLETYPRHREGVNVYIGPDGAVKKFEGDIFPVPPATEQEILTLIEKLDALVAEIDPEEPWAHPQRRASTRSRSRAGSETQTDDEEARENVGMFIAGAMLTKPAHAFSALQALLMAASAGRSRTSSMPTSSSTVGSWAASSRFPVRLAERLGDVVKLSQPVRTLRWSGSTDAAARRPQSSP